MGRPKSSPNTILCACGCGKTLLDRDKWGKIRTHINGHNRKGNKFSKITRQKLSLANLGKKPSEETKKKIGLAQTGDKGSNWKGDNVGYSGLHQRMNKIIPKPLDGKCSSCYKVTRLTACVTGIYNTDLENWAWLCYSCHQEYDRKMGFIKPASESTKMKMRIAQNKRWSFKANKERHSQAARRGWLKRRLILVH